MQAYCLKCGAHRDVKDPEQVEMKNGRHRIRGTCSVCGAKVSSISKPLAAASSEDSPRS